MHMPYIVFWRLFDVHDGICLYAQNYSIFQLNLHLRQFRDWLMVNPLSTKLSLDIRMFYVSFSFDSYCNGRINKLKIVQLTQSIARSVHFFVFLQTEFVKANRHDLTCIHVVYFIYLLYSIILSGFP